MPPTPRHRLEDSPAFMYRSSRACYIRIRSRFAMLWADRGAAVQTLRASASRRYRIHWYRIRSKCFRAGSHKIWRCCRNGVANGAQVAVLHERAYLWLSLALAVGHDRDLAGGTLEPSMDHVGASASTCQATVHLPFTGASKQTMQHIVCNTEFVESTR